MSDQALISKLGRLSDRALVALLQAMEACKKPKEAMKPFIDEIKRRKAGVK